MQEQPKIGQLVEGNPGRDAIHIAIAPVVAGEQLVPGQHVGFLPDGRIGDSNNIDVDLIGIVDPYLQQDVYENDKFYLFIYPNTVTSLRHVWSHPAFKVKVPEFKGDKV